MPKLMHLAHQPAPAASASLVRRRGWGEGEGVQQTRSGHAGFTLVELMVVMVLIGVVTAMILPEMRGTYEAALLRSTARQLVDTFALAYSRAVTLNRTQVVRLDLHTGKFKVESAGRALDEKSAAADRDIAGGEGQLDARIALQMRKSSTAESPDPPEPEEAAGGSPTGGRPDGFAFYPDGTADPGEIVLRDREGFRLALRINATTGRVHIVELERE